VVDLLPAYRGLRWEILVADGAADEHPNEVAHRIAAQTLLRALDEVLPPAARAVPEQASETDESDPAGARPASSPR
jgi:hypothetical protein